MPSIPDRTQQQRPVQARVETPPDFPDIPQEILDRFPSAADWQRRLVDFWIRTNQAIQTAQVQTANQVNAMTVFSPETFKVSDQSNTGRPIFFNDGTGIRLGHVLVVNTAGLTLHVGVGEYFNANTPIYMDVDGKFSLGGSFAYDPSSGGIVVNITSGAIAGFAVGADYVRDVANSFGLASTVTAGDDVRLWAGNTFANRATAPFRVSEAGVVFIGTGAFNGTIGATTPSTGAFTTVTVTTLETINGNGGALTAPPSTTYLHIAGADGAIVRQTIDSFAASGQLYFRRADTSNAAKSAVQNNEQICAVVGAGYGASAYGGATAYMAYSATENWSNTAQGTKIDFAVTPNGSTTAAVGLTLVTAGLTVVGSVTTSAPTGGAGAWKLGKYAAGVVAQAGQVTVNIDGVDRILLTA